MEIFALIRFHEPEIADSIYKLERVGENLYWLYQGVAYYLSLMDEETISFPTFEKPDFYGTFIYDEEEFRQACENITPAFFSKTLFRFGINGKASWIVDTNGNNYFSNFQK